MKKLLLLAVICLNTVAFAQCDIKYATTSGVPSAAGTMGDPLDLETAFLTASPGDLIRLGVGTYVIDNPIYIMADDVIFEGGYDDNNAWQRTSIAGATTIQRSNLNPEGATNAQRIVAVYADSVNGWELHDITITTQNTLENGASNYGMHIQNCANYKLVRCQVMAGNASTGLNGTPGQVGANGSIGLNGLAGSIDGNCSGGTGGAGGAGGGGAPATSGGVNPAGCDQTGGNGGAGAASSSNRNGGAGGGGGAGGETDNNGGYGGNGGGINGGPPQTGGGIGGAWGDPGGDGTNGNNGTNGLNGIAGSAGPAGTLGMFFTPGLQANSGNDGYGGKGGKGGGGGGGQSCFLCDDGSGDGGGGGGGGGQGGTGGTGGFGGGGSFGVYLYNNGLNGEIIDSYITAGQAGNGGSGGAGGAGGSGGAGGNGSSYGSSEVGEGGDGGNGGSGGNGGNGGAGASGQSIAFYLNSGDTLAQEITSFNLAAQPEITVDYATCTGESMSFMDETLPVGTNNTLWNFGTNASSQFSTSNPATTSFNVAGMHDITQSGNVYTSFVHITCSVDPSATQSGTTITANAAGAIYQWVDCNAGYSAISGETNQSYTPTVTGDYAVIVTENGCSDTSACFNVDYTGLEELNANGIHIYPNPVNDILHISVNQSNADYVVKIFNTSGSLVDEQVLSGKQLFDHPFDHPKGVYLIEITTDDKSFVERIVKL